MRVKVRLFASLREILGREFLDCEMPEGARVAELVDRLLDQDGRLARYRGRLAFAVNDRHVRGDRPLAEGDQVALLPPVSGGRGG